jgi:squalene cyclase
MIRFGWPLVAAGAAMAALVLMAPQAQDEIQEITAASEESVRKGILWLRECQNRDGSWGCEKGQLPSTAISVLAGLALLASGSTPNDGPLAKEIRKGVDFLLSVQGRRGQITCVDTTGIGINFDHAAAVVFLAEAYGMMRAESPDNDTLKKRVALAIEYLDTIQNGDGGWSPAGKESNSDLAVTATVFSAMRSAFNAGIPINHANVEKLESFCQKCKVQTGGYTQFGGGGGRGMMYSTSAGIRIMYGLGRAHEPEVTKATEALLKMQIAGDYGGRISEWDYVAVFFATLALIKENGPYWKKWFPKIRDYLVKKQNQDGSWTVEYCMSCRAFATALSLLVLEAPKRVLPLWQL